MSTLKVDTILKRTGTGTITLGQSGDTIALGSGASSTGFGVAGTNSFKAEMSATNTSVSDNTYTKVAFNTDTFDTDSVFDTSNNRFIAPADGKYFFVSSVYMYANTANGNKSFTTFYKNGSIDNRTVTAIELGGSDNYLASTTILNSAIFNLSQNDYIEVYAKMDVPSGNLSFNLTHSFFSGYRIA
jgi:hypothetical protein